jgi:hypothetical protein
MPSTFPASPTQSTGPASFYATGISLEGTTRGTRFQFTNPTTAASAFTDIYVYTHAGAAGDHFIVAIYDDSAGYPNHRLWYSGSTGSASTTWNHVAEASGTVDNSWDGSYVHNSYYWIIIQWDNVVAGASYAVGSANTGIYLAQTYGTLLSTWSGGTLSTENWSIYCTYSETPPGPANITDSVIGLDVVTIFDLGLPLRFGPLELPHALTDQREDSWVQIEHDVPGRNVAYRAAKRSNGRTFTMSGEIRATSIQDVLQQIEFMRRLSDGVVRELYLGDSATYAMLGDVDYKLDFTGLWPKRIPYQLTFLECEAPT